MPNHAAAERAAEMLDAFPHHPQAAAIVITYHYEPLVEAAREMLQECDPDGSPSRGPGDYGKFCKAVQAARKALREVVGNE
jgi:hypothetical protein